MPTFGIPGPVKLGSTLAACALTLLLVAACSSDDDTASPEVTKVTIPPTDTPTSLPTPESTGCVPASGSVGAETLLTIRTPSDDLKFDCDFMSAKAGTEVVVTYVNDSTVFQHTWALVKAGTKDAVSADGGQHPENAYVPPEDDRVLAFMEPLVEPGETREFRFPAPPVGKYEFVCTFPGHNATKFGVFEVTP